ncbi:VOC family protein [Chloroflexota bacterium]
MLQVDFPPIMERSGHKVSFPKLGGAIMEVMEYSDKEHAEGLSHLCFEVDDIEATVDTFTAKGLKLREPGIRDLPGRRAAFFEPDNTLDVLIQIVQFKPDRTESSY